MTEHTYVGPSSMIAGRGLQGLNNWMRHNFVGKINSSCEFDQGDAELHRARIFPQGNVRLQIIHISFGTVVHMLSHRNKEQFASTDKALCTAGASCLPKAAEKSNRITTFRKSIHNVKKIDLRFA